jgi:hypothetical protein
MHWSPRFIPLPEPRVSARLELAESQYHSITETIQRSHHRANESNLAHQNWMVEIHNKKQVSGLAPSAESEVKSNCNAGKNVVPRTNLLHQNGLGQRQLG